MHILGRLARWLFIIALPILLITSSIALAINSNWLYNYGFQKYGISQVTGLAPSELEKAAAGLIDYFNSGQEWIDLSVSKNGRSFALFNQREISHLKDVKDLIGLDYRVLLASLTYAFAYASLQVLLRRNLRRLAHATLFSTGASLGLIVVLGLVALFGFDQFFLMFHLISFTNDLWQLNPLTDYLIMMFPQGFWNDAAIFIVAGAALGALLLGGLAAAYLRFARNQPAARG